MEFEAADFEVLGAHEDVLGAVGHEAIGVDVAAHPQCLGAVGDAHVPQVDVYALAEGLGGIDDGVAQGDVLVVPHGGAGVVAKVAAGDTDVAIVPDGIAADEVAAGGAYVVAVF